MRRVVTRETGRAVRAVRLFVIASQTGRGDGRGEPVHEKFGDSTPM